MKSIAPTLLLERNRMIWKSSFAAMMLIFLGCQQQKAEQAEATPEPPAVEQQGFSQLEWKIVDRRKAMEENPNLIEVVNDTNETGYLTAVTKSSFSAISRLNTGTMEYNAKLQSYLNADGSDDPKPLSFEEFDAAARQNSNNIKGLYPWQVYAYDESTGKVTILEDRDEKRRMYEERGLQYKDDE